MEITIDGIQADITLEAEKTVGELLSGIDAWLTGSGYRMSGLEVDGEIIGASALGGALGRELEHIKVIDIKTTGEPMLTLEALCGARNMLDAFCAAAPEERRRLAAGWNEDAADGYLGENSPELAEIIRKTLGGEGPLPRETGALINERIREIENPREEILRIEPVLMDTVKRLEDLPLDIQTGKDGRAAETVSLFSNIAEKLLRLIGMLNRRELSPEAAAAEVPPIRDFIEDFGAALRELLAAYETKDAVLIGDLAEYEVAPRLFELFSTVKTAASA
jgi:hypothetical protein